MMTRPRLLLSAAALLVPGLWAQGAQAQLDFANLSPDLIAADVTSQFNARTGVEELVGPTFDPFGEDEAIAAELSMRTTTNARDLDGQLMTDGVLLDVSLFYTRDGDAGIDPTRTRDALYLNGAPVPIVQRDTREVECSSRVTETVYLSDRYYGGLPGYRGLTRRRPTYLGYGYGHDYGGYYGAGYGGYGYAGSGYGYIPTRPRRPRRPRSDTGGDVPATPAAPVQPRVYDVSRYDRSDDSGRGRPRLGRDIRGKSIDKPRQPRTRPRKRDRTRRVSPTTNPVTATRSTDRSPRERTRRPDLRVSPDSRTLTPDSRPPARTRTPKSRADSPPIMRRDPRPAPAPRQPDRRPQPSRPQTSRPQATRPQATRPQAPRPRPQASTPSKSKSTPPPRTKSSSRPSVSRDRNRRTGLDLFPQDYGYGGYGGDAVVVQSTRDCAVEDRLTLFIPSDRLEAARFDGLMLVLRDVSDGGNGQTLVYDERPLFVPPNYIEGFQLGAGVGREP